MFVFTAQMKKFFYKVSIFISLLFFIICLTNYISDPANLFHEISDKMVEELLNGDSLYPTSSNFNARLLKKKFIDNCPKNLDTISVGPSFANTLTAQYANSSNYYNFSVPGGDFNDILATLAIIKNEKVQFKRIIISLDTIYFDKRFLDTNPLSLEYRNYTNEMLDQLYNDKNHRIKNAPRNKNKKLLLLKELFSPIYFRSSVEFICEKKFDVFTRWHVLNGNENEETIDSSFFIDKTGSNVYFPHAQNNSLSRVLKNSFSYNFNSFITKNAHADPFYVETFNKLISALHSDGKKIEIFITPLPPALYQRLNRNEYPLFTETEEIAQNLKNEFQDIKIFGNYNPEIGGFTNDDFIDERHLKAPSYQKLFQTN